MTAAMGASRARKRSHAAAKGESASSRSDTCQSTVSRVSALKIQGRDALCGTEIAGARPAKVQIGKAVTK